MGSNIDRPAQASLGNDSHCDVDTNPSDDVARSRSKTRNRLIYLGALTAGLGRFGGLLVTLLSVPMAVDALGTERFGIWITVTTLAGFIALLDGGIGNSLVNLTAECVKANDQKRLTAILSSSYCAISCIAAIGIPLHYVLVSLLDWKWLLSLPDSVSAAEVRRVVLIFGITYFLLMPLSLSSKILVGIQRIHMTGYASLAGHAITLISTFLAWRFGAGLTVFILCFASGPIVAGVANTIMAWTRESRRYLPTFRFDRDVFFQQVLRTGLLFWVLQVCAIIAFQTDSLIVANIAGLTSAGEFGLTSRLFQIVYSLALLVIVPLWPAVREASLSGDYEWIRKSLTNTILVCMSVSLLATVPAAMMFDTINGWWTDDRIHPSALLVASVCIWTNMLVLGNILTMFLNGLQIIRVQVVCSLAMALLNIGLSIGLTRSIGSPGVVIGSIVSYTITVLIPFAFIIPRVMRQTKTTPEGS